MPIGNIYNTGKAEYGIAKLINSAITYGPCYYLSESSAKETGGTDPEIIKSKSEKNMKTEAFVEAMGDAFVYKENSYPILGFEVSNSFLKIDEKSLALTKYNEEKQLSVFTNIRDEIAWLSSDTSVATVEDGVVKAVGNGSATIYAVSGSCKAECPVTVEYDYKLDKTEITIEPENTEVISVVTVDDKPAGKFSDAVWKSSDELVATVANGKVTAVAEGTAEISVEFGGLKLVCSVTVKKADDNNGDDDNKEDDKEEPKLDPVSASLEIGKTLELSIENYTGNVTWLSSDSKTVSVSAKGEVTAIKKGKAIVYAMLDDDKALSCTITVIGVKGDANGDSELNVADLVLLQKWLLGETEELPEPETVDINEDGRIDAYDMVLLRQLVIGTEK